MPSDPDGAGEPPLTPATALGQLLDGYTRFSTGRPQHPRQSHADLARVAAAPRPVAVILGCADARVPPEVIFDQGFGDLFVVRLAGNVATDHAIGGIEVAVAEMAAPLVVVLGHTRCRAVQTALDALIGSGQATGHLGGVVEALLPAVGAVASHTGDRLSAAVRENVRRTASVLRDSEPVLAPAVRAGRLEVRGWLYDVDNGLLEMLA